MKIRTDFVTNSSSSNYITISIKNPKLMQIVGEAKRTEEDEKRYGGYKEEVLDIDESEQTVTLKMEISHDLAPRIEMPEDMIGVNHLPKNLNGLYQNFMKLLEVSEDYRARRYDHKKLCKALEKNGKDIIADTESVEWDYEAEGWGEAALFDWFWELVNYIAEKEELDYVPSYVGITRSFRYEKENGRPSVGQLEEFSYGEPFRMDEIIKNAEGKWSLEMDDEEDEEEEDWDSDLETDDEEDWKLEE